MSYLDDVLRALKSLGMKAHAREFQRCLSALRVIHTWATFPRGRTLDPVAVAALTERALRPYRSAKRTGGGTK